MCGFSGLIGVGRSPGYLYNDIYAMTNAIYHRGPDSTKFIKFSFQKSSIEFINSGEKIENSDNFDGVLGFNRLSIRDLSENGDQPMISADKNVAIVFNGELYGVRSLRKKLVLSNYNFKGTSDTEVLLASYLQYGLKKTLEYIDGMYAFVIVNIQSKTIVLCRDHVGIKPLYYIEESDCIAWSSEVKSFLCLTNFKPVLNRNSLHEFLIFRSNSGSNLMSGVKEVSPGGVVEMRFTGAHKHTNIYSHYNLPSWNVDVSSNSRRASILLEEYLDTAISSQLISDVPIGCQLSGGIDSSLIVNKLSRSVDQLKTFSIIFNDENFSEKFYIDYVKNNLNIVNYQYQLDQEYIHDNFEKCTWHLDSPITHPNTIGIYALSENISQHLSVVLSGEGADEVLGGYPRYIIANLRMEKFIALFRVFLKKTNIQALKGLGRHYSRELNFIMMSSKIGEVSDIYNLWPEFDYESAVSSRLDAMEKSPSFLQNCLDYDMHYYLDPLLKRQDKMTMAHSVENRVPFLSKNFIDSVRSNIHINDLINPGFSLPTWHHINHSTKIALKDIASKHFNSKFAYRQKKGFPVPISHFLDNSKAVSRFNDCYASLISSALNVDIDKIRKFYMLTSDYELKFTLYSLGAYLLVFNLK